MTFSQDTSDWLHAAEKQLSTFSVTERDCGRTPLRFRTADPQVVQWVKRAIAPLMDEHCEPVEDVSAPPLRFDYLYDDALADRMIQQFIEHDHCRVHEDITSRGSYRHDYADGRTAIAIPGEGIAMHLDMEERRFTFVHSSRTRFPAIQFGDMVYEPLLRSALDSGAVPFHAGAVATDKGAILIVGYSGDGKTSLVTGLMHAGASFLANERTLVKQTGSEFRAYSFPDWINLGLGTVMNDSALAGLLPVPNRISVPQGRFDWGRPYRYEQSEWPHLDDKITLLCDELSDMLGAPPPTSGVPIVGIVRPKVTRRPIDARLTPIEGNHLTDLLDDNVSSLTHYPDWMGWNPSETDPDIDALAELPALRLRYYLDDGHVQGMDNVMDELYQALDAERSRKAKTSWGHTELAPI